MTDAQPTFEIARAPKRRYSRHGGFEYAGGTVFSLSPPVERSEGELDELLHSVLASGPYTYGDWFDLPMTIYLVTDENSNDVFRVSSRDGRIEIHVLPTTDPVALRTFYHRLGAESDTGWHVDRRIDG